MKVKLKKTGQIGTIPDDKFDPNLFEKVSETPTPAPATAPVVTTPTQPTTPVVTPTAPVTPETTPTTTPVTTPESTTTTGEEYKPVTRTTLEGQRKALSKALATGNKDLIKYVQGQVDIEKANFDDWAAMQDAVAKKKTAEETTKSQEDLKTNALDIATQLKGMDYGKITGAKGIGAWEKKSGFLGLSGEKVPMFPGAPAQATLNKFKQLKGILSLENIKYLKGTGTISDAEEKLLAEAASALDTNLSNKDFGKELDKVITGLGGTVESAATEPTKPGFFDKAGEQLNKKTGILGWWFGSTIDNMKDEAATIILKGKTGKQLEESFQQSTDFANKVLESATQETDPEKKAAKEKIAFDTLNKIAENRTEITKMFSESLQKFNLNTGGGKITGKLFKSPAFNTLNYYVGRALGESSELVGTADLIYGIAKKAIDITGKVAGKVTEQLAPKVGEEAVKTIAEETKPSLGAKAGKLLDKFNLKRILSEKQAGAVVNTAINPDNILKAGEKLANIDTDVASAMEKYGSDVSKIKNGADLLDNLEHWGDVAYTKGGDIASSAKAKLYNEFYHAGIEELKDVAPEAYKYRQLLRYTFNLPKTTGKWLWRIFISKGILAGFGG